MKTDPNWSPDVPPARKDSLKVRTICGSVSRFGRDRNVHACWSIRLARKRDLRADLAKPNRLQAAASMDMERSIRVPDAEKLRLNGTSWPAALIETDQP
jgi:hypothetical protein